MATKAEVAIIIKFKAQLKELDKASKTMKKFGNNMKSAGKTLRRNVTLPLLAMGVASLKAASDLDTAMRNIQAVTGQTNEQIAQMSQDMIDLSTSMDTGAFSAKTFAESMFDIQSAGFSGAEAMQILDVSSRAASAGQAELSRATDVTLTVLKAWNLQASETERINDVLFAGVRIGKQTFESLASGIRTVAPTFAAFNIPIEDATAALTLFANKGTDSAEAATQLKSIVLEMNAPTAELAALIRKAGFESGRQMLATLGTTKALKVLNDVSKQENVILSDTFANRRAAIGIMTLTGENMNELINIQGQLNNSSGELNTAFAEQAKAFGFQFKKMVASIQEVAIIIGQELIPIITPMIEKIKEAAEWFSNLDATTKKNIVRFGVLVAILGPLLIIFGSIITSATAIVGLFTAIAASSTAASVGTALLNAAMWLLSANPITIALLAVVAAIGVLMLLFPTMRQAVTDFVTGLGDGIMGVVNDIEQGLLDIKNAVKKFFGFDTGKKAGSEFGNGLANGMVEQTGQGVKAVVQGTTQAVQAVGRGAQRMGTKLKQVGQEAASVVALMSIATGDPNKGFMGADIQALAADIKQQVLAGVGGTGSFDLGQFSGGGFSGGSLLDALKSSDITEGEKQQIIETLGLGGVGITGAAGDINITIETLSVPAGTNEEQVDLIIKAIGDKLKQQGVNA